MAHEPTQTTGNVYTRARARLKALGEEYGPVAIYTYLAIFFGVWASFAAALKLGFQPEGATAGTGLVFSAWAATKVTQPVRIAATVGLTPVIARVVRRVRNRPVAATEPTVPPAAPLT